MSSGENPLALPIGRITHSRADIIRIVEGAAALYRRCGGVLSFEATISDIGAGSCRFVNPPLALKELAQRMAADQLKIG